METTNSHVFISYARADGREYAERLYSELRGHGILAWRDERQLDPYQDFTAELEKAIKRASHVAVCITPDTTRDDSFVRREIGYALGCGKRIIPLMFADILPQIAIINLTRVDFRTQTWEHAFSKLLYRLEQPTSAYEAPTRPDDPFRDYLDALYQQIVEYLDITVFSHLTLHSKSTPDAVRGIPALLTSFFGTALQNRPRPNLTQPDRRFAYFTEAFEHYDGRVLLLGEPGAGKTTTLMAFARDAVASRLEDPSRPLPILARISDWLPNKMPTLVDWLTATLSALPREAITKVILSGKGLLLLDGLDELGGEQPEKPTNTGEAKERTDPRSEFMDILTRHGEQNQWFAMSKTSNRVVVTCRIKDYTNIGEKITLEGAVTLQPLDELQIANYLAGYPDLLASMRADDGLREMARTPLLLSIFTYAYSSMNEKELKQLRNLQKSPGDLRDRIFRTYVERRYLHEKQKPNAKLPYTLNKMREVLGAVAARHIMRGERESQIRRETVQEVLGHDPETFIEQAHRLHILAPLDGSTLRFIHLLLRDHFAFESLVSILQDKINAREAVVMGILKINDPRKVAALINILREISDENSEFGFDIALQEAVVWALVELGDEAIPELWEALNDKNTSLSAIADSILSEISEYHAIDFERLLEDLYNWNSDIRESAAELLGEMEDPDAVPYLIEALNDYSWFVQREAAYSLYLIGTSEALAAEAEWRRKENQVRRHQIPKHPAEVG